MIWGPLKFENQLTDQILNSYVNFGLGFGFWSEVHLSEMTCYKIHTLVRNIFYHSTSASCTIFHW